MSVDYVYNIIIMQILWHVHVHMYVHVQRSHFEERSFSKVVGYTCTYMYTTLLCSK